MKLHQDRDAFLIQLEGIHSKTGHRQDVLEKDYYVVLLLKELAEMQQAGLPAYFKGGTALYKALKTINRFSEDIDLSVETRDCNRSQNDKRLEKAAKKYSSMLRDSSQGRTNRSEVVSMYTYEPVTPCDHDDALQRFGRMKVEATSFTISEPVENLEISTLLYDLSSEEQKRVLESVYEVKPFSVQTITMERIFVDKLFAAEAYVRNASVPHRAFEATKHIYDLAVMEKHPRITQLMSNPEQMGQLLAIRMEEELKRLDGIPGVAPTEFTFFTAAENNANVCNSYETMLNQYVLHTDDRIEFKVATSSLLRIQEKLLNNLAWRNYQGQSQEDPEQTQSNLLMKNKQPVTHDKTILVYPAQPDRTYRGPMVAYQDGLFIQEISPGVGIGHQEDTLHGIAKADIGKNFTISYDNNGSASITQERQRDRGNEIDR